MSDLSDLVTFLRARLDEEEALAKAAAVDSETWRFDESLPCAAIVAYSARWESTLGSGLWQCDDPYDDCEDARRGARAEAEHIVYWDPERVLAEIAAKRVILDGFDPIEHPTGPLYALAQPYADHEAFDSTWRT